VMLRIAVEVTGTVCGVGCSIFSQTVDHLISNIWLNELIYECVWVFIDNCCNSVVISIKLCWRTLSLSEVASTKLYIP